MSFQRIEEHDGRDPLIVRYLCFVIERPVLGHKGGIHNHTERPMQRLVDRDDDELLQEYVDIFVLGPFGHGSNAFVVESGVEVR